MTKAQKDAIAQQIRDKWTQFALGGDVSIAPSIVDSVQWVYSLDKLQAPPVFVAGSPYGAQVVANYLTSPDAVRSLAASDPFIAGVIADTDLQLENHGIKLSPVQGLKSRVDSLAFLDSVTKHPFTSENGALTYFDFNYTGIGYDTSWTSFYEYLCEIKESVNPDDDCYKQVVSYLKSGVWDSIFFLEAAVVCRRPAESHFDDNTRLHNLRGPAVAWSDGYENYFIHNMSINSEWIKKPETLSLDVILKEQNVELRRAMVEIVGMKRFLSEGRAVVVDSWVDGGKQSGDLVRLEVEDDEPVQVYIYRDPSTGKEGPLRVPPDITSAKDAVAWTYNIPPEEYNPLVEA